MNFIDHLYEKNQPNKLFSEKTLEQEQDDAEMEIKNRMSKF